MAKDYESFSTLAVDVGKFKEKYAMMYSDSSLYDMVQLINTSTPIPDIQNIDDNNWKILENYGYTVTEVKTFIKSHIEDPTATSTDERAKEILEEKILPQINMLIYSLTNDQWDASDMEGMGLIKEAIERLNTIKETFKIFIIRANFMANGYKYYSINYDYTKKDAQLIENGNLKAEWDTNVDLIKDMKDKILEAQVNLIKFTNLKKENENNRRIDDRARNSNKFITFDFLTYSDVTGDNLGKVSSLNFNPRISMIGYTSDQVVRNYNKPTEAINFTFTIGGMKKVITEVKLEEMNTLTVDFINKEITQDVSPSLIDVGVIKSFDDRLQRYCETCQANVFETNWAYHLRDGKCWEEGLCEPFATSSSSNIDASSNRIISNRNRLLNEGNVDIDCTNKDAAVGFTKEMCV